MTKGIPLTNRPPRMSIAAGSFSRWWENVRRSLRAGTSRRLHQRQGKLWGRNLRSEAGGSSASALNWNCVFVLEMRFVRTIRTCELCRSTRKSFRNTDFDVISPCQIIASQWRRGESNPEDNPQNKPIRHITPLSLSERGHQWTSGYAEGHRKTKNSCEVRTNSALTYAAFCGGGLAG
jgi:hypothetical protein